MRNNSNDVQYLFMSAEMSDLVKIRPLCVRRRDCVQYSLSPRRTRPQQRRLKGNRLQQRRVAPVCFGQTDWIIFLKKKICVIFS